MIYSWTAKRAGAGITIRGTRDGLPIKLVNVASITLRAGHVGRLSAMLIIAVMKDGAMHQLAAM